MKYINLRRNELADNFEHVANDFYEFIKANRLDEVRVDMDVAGDTRSLYGRLCDTPACHGGWAAIMYGEQGYLFGTSFYNRGAEILAKKLGFEGRIAYEQWAATYPEYWGNRYGDNMFKKGEAFEEDSDFPLIFIPNWYMKVAKNLRES